MNYFINQKIRHTLNTKITQQRVDAILDKINQQGYSSLTDEEKVLQKASREEGCEQESRLNGKIR